MSSGGGKFATILHLFGGSSYPIIQLINDEPLVALLVLHRQTSKEGPHTNIGNVTAFTANLVSGPHFLPGDCLRGWMDGLAVNEFIW